MPHRARNDENANVPLRRRPNGAQGVRRILSTKPASSAFTNVTAPALGVKSNNSKSASGQARTFAKEIQNIARQTRRGPDALTLPTIYHDVVLESGAFKALVGEFETLKLQPDEESTSDRAKEAEDKKQLNQLVNASDSALAHASLRRLGDTSNIPANLSSLGRSQHQAQASPKSTVKPSSMMRPAKATDRTVTEVLLAQATTSKTVSVPGIPRAASKAVSFHAESVISHSTSLGLGKRTSHHGTTTEALLDLDCSTAVLPSTCALGNEVQGSRFPHVSNSQSQDQVSGHVIMSQLASHLSQLVLSPCLEPSLSLEHLDLDLNSLDEDSNGDSASDSEDSVATDSIPELDLDAPRRTTRSSLARAQARLRAKSISLGYISTAFPEVAEMEFVLDV